MTYVVGFATGLGVGLLVARRRVRAARAAGRRALWNYVLADSAVRESVPDPVVDVKADTGQSIHRIFTWN